MSKSNSFTWQMPEEEIWVQEVKMDTPEVLNEFFRKVAEQKNVRSIQIHRCDRFGYILVSYERNVNFKEVTNDEPTA